MQRLLSEPAAERAGRTATTDRGSPFICTAKRKMPRHFARREDRMKSLISPVQRRPPVLPGPTPREDDATSTAPVSGRTVATTESRVVREARNYADPDILAPRWLRVSDTPFDAPIKRQKVTGGRCTRRPFRMMRPTGSRSRRTAGPTTTQEEASPSRLPHQLVPRPRRRVADRAGVLPADGTSSVKGDAVPQGPVRRARLPRAAQGQGAAGLLAGADAAAHCAVGAGRGVVLFKSGTLCGCWMSAALAGS